MFAYPIRRTPILLGLLVTFVLLSWADSLPIEAEQARANVQPVASHSTTAEPTRGWDCWGPGMPDPCQNLLLSVTAISQTDTWAVGTMGTILHGNGGAWSRMKSPSNQRLHSVAIVPGTGGHQAWAVGEGGAILRWDGATWASVSSPAGPYDWLNSVVMQSPAAGWIAGSNGILHWNGAAWGKFSGTEGLWLRAIAFGTADDGWAVGNSGVILHWNGVSWQSVTSPTQADILGLTVVSASEAWAVGRNGTLLRLQGGAWQQISSPTTKELDSVRNANFITVRSTLAS